MNITVKGSSCSSPANPSAAKLGKVFTYSLILAGSLVGNFFIGIIVYKTQTMRKPINYFIANMATSDLLYPIFQIPWNLRELYADSWPMSGPSDVAWCKLVPFLADVSTVVSIQSLVLIAVDRFGAVVFPLRSPLISSKRCPFFIFTTWIVAIAICSPYLFAFKLVEHTGQMACKRKWNEAFGEYFSDAIYFLTLFVVFFYLPIAVLIILYSIILIKLKTQIFPGEQSVNAEQQRVRRNRKVLKMAIAIVVAFVLCWVPFSIMALLSLFVRDRGRSVPCAIHHYWLIPSLMATANCAVNPCICFIFSTNYRQGLKRLLNYFGATQEE